MPIPTADPRSVASSSATNVSCQPRNAPTIASILTSPMPRPSSPRNQAYALATPSSRPPPAAAPSSASGQPGSTTTAAARPAPMPVSVTASGRTRCRRSVTKSTTSAAHSSRRAASSGCQPSRSYCSRNRAGVASSTSGYAGGIRAPQVRQRPRSASQAASGTFSNQRSGRPQAMQAEAGETTDCERGSRWMQTLRKLPTARPAAASSNGIAGAVMVRACRRPACIAYGGTRQRASSRASARSKNGGASPPFNTTPLMTNVGVASTASASAAAMSARTSSMTAA